LSGASPSYLHEATESVPNAAALGRRIWAPGLDDGYVPQGLASAGDYLFVSAYHPEPEEHSPNGTCRVFRIERATGRTAGSFGLPAGLCGHAGGLAYLGNGRLLLADTRRIFGIDLARALASGQAEGAMEWVELSGALRGSFAAFDGRDAWIGTWTHDANQSHMYRLSPRIFDEFDRRTVDEREALGSIAIPLEAQGAAFARDGDLWLSASNSKWGRLYRLDPSGKVKAEYEMTAGLEGLAFDSGGHLWALSESGSRKYLYWGTAFPFVFEIDVSRLR